MLPPPETEAIPPESDEPVYRPSESDTPTTSSPADPLQIAAQDYPWLYMNSTLDACFEESEKSARPELATSVQADDETAGKVNISFHDEAAADQFAKTAPEVMHAFISHGETCTQMDTEALQVASQEPEDLEDHDAPIQIYNDLLSRIDSLLEEAHSLETSILELTHPPDLAPASQEKVSTATPRSQILSMFSACLPLLHARVDNLTIARQLVEGAKENYAMNLQMEVLGLDDSEDDT